MKKILGIPLIFVLTVFSFGTVWAGPQTPPSAPVTVLNTGSNPVPVTGNVGIKNSPANPVWTAQGGEPYSQNARGDCNDNNCSINFPQVPAGKRLVILHVGAYARPNSSATIFDFAELVTSDPQDPQFGTAILFPMQLIGRAGGAWSFNTYALNASVLAFVEAGQYARLTLAQQNQGSVFFSQGTISGYLVPVSP